MTAPSNMPRSKSFLERLWALENDERPGLEYCWADFVLEDGVYAPKAWPCAAGPMFVPMGE